MGCIITEDSEFQLWPLLEAFEISKPASLQPRKPPKPYVESLPAEILKHIFIHSRNPAFIFCSSYVHGLVYEYDDVKKLLIEWCCQAPGLSSDKTNKAHHQLRWLLHEKWMSLGWIMDSAADWLMHEMSWRLTQIEKTPGYTVWPGERQRVAKALAKRKKNPHLWFESQPEALIEIEKARPHGVAYCQLDFSEFEICEPSYFDSEMNASFVPTLHSLAPFPSKLLRGPWTQREGDLLSFFMYYVKLGSPILSNRRLDFPYPVRIKLSPRQERDLAAGLLNALETRHLPALAILGGGVRRFSSHKAACRGYSAEDLIRPKYGGKLDEDEWKAVRTRFQTPETCVFPHRLWTQDMFQALLRMVLECKDEILKKFLIRNGLSLIELWCEKYDRWKYCPTHEFMIARCEETFWKALNKEQTRERKDYWYRRGYHSLETVKCHR